MGVVPRRVDVGASARVGFESGVEGFSVEIEDEVDGFSDSDVDGFESGMTDGTSNSGGRI